MHPEIERHFRNQETANPIKNVENYGYTPKTNVSKFDEYYHIEMAAPGRSKEEFSIKLEEDILTVSYEFRHDENKGPEDFKFIRKEFENGSFTRSFTLPETTDKEKISAKYENGILSINIPFEDPKKNSLSKTINVN
jgi:HSP20 family protein